MAKFPTFCQLLQSLILQAPFPAFSHFSTQPFSLFLTWLRRDDPRPSTPYPPDQTTLICGLGLCCIGFWLKLLLNVIMYDILSYSCCLFFLCQGNATIFEITENCKGIRQGFPIKEVGNLMFFNCILKILKRCFEKNLLFFSSIEQSCLTNCLAVAESQLLALLHVIFHRQFSDFLTMWTHERWS